MKHAFTFDMLLAAGLIALLSNTSAHATAVPGQGTWETTLQARDVNGDGTVDAYYDTSSNLTWLADANPVLRTEYLPPSTTLPSYLDSNGAGSYFGFLGEWAGLINVYGVTGWRLPTVVDQSGCPGFPSPCVIAMAPGSSELENLFTKTLGNTTGQLNNTGPFRNVVLGPYWTGTMVGGVYKPDPSFWTHNPATGKHEAFLNYGTTASVWAVHDGDVPAIPEPGTAVLMGLGLASAALLDQRRKQCTPF